MYEKHTTQDGIRLVEYIFGDEKHNPTTRRKRSPEEKKKRKTKSQRSSDLPKHRLHTPKSQQYHTEQSKKEMNNISIYSNPNFVIIGNSQFSHELLVKCNHCEKHVYITRKNLLSRPICPYCKRGSKAEEATQQLLDSLNIDYRIQYSVVHRTKRFRFDFAIYENKKLVLLIEIDGEQHRKQNTTFTSHNLEEQEYFDNLKNTYCNENGIHLERINYTWNIRRVTDCIKNILTTYNLIPTETTEILEVECDDVALKTFHRTVAKPDISWFI